MARRRSTARDLAQIAVFAALIAALGLPGGLTFGVSPVPITLQTLGVMLAGAILGARKGFLAVVLFIVLTAAGLPLLAGGRGGIAYLSTAPTAGYPYGWLVGVVFIGYLTVGILPRYPMAPALAITAIGGIGLVYAVGVPVYAFNTSTSVWLGFVDSTKFLPGDIVKVIVTVVVAKQVHRAYPGLIPRSVRRADHPV